MSSAVIPPWKIALQQKLDKKKDDERRKLLEEEQRRLEALPPWKRMGMMPKNVIIISGGTKTVSQLSTDSDLSDGVKPEENTKRKVVVNDTKTDFGGSRSRPSIKIESQHLGHDGHLGRGNRNSVAERTRTSAVNKVQENHVISLQNEDNLTNHVEHDEGTRPMSPRSQGVDEEHVSSVFDNPFLKHDGGTRRRRSKLENDTTVTKKQPDNNIRQRSRSASPRRAAREHNIDLKTSEDDVKEMRSRKNSVSDLRSRFGRVASTDDLKVVSRKHSESSDTSPLSPMSPRSPTASLDRNKLHDEQPSKVHINFKSDSPNKQTWLSPTSKPADKTTTSENKAPSSKSENTVSLQSETKVSIVNANGIPSQKSETKSTSVTHAKVEIDLPPSNSVKTKRQAPKPPSESGSDVSSKKNEMPAKTVTSSALSSSTADQNMLNNNLSKSNKHVESSTTSTATNHEVVPDQPKTAILGDGQSSLRRKKGTSKMSASALISLSGDSSSSNDVQLSEHNARVRAARQEARSSTSNNLLRSGRDAETKDTDNIPKGVVSSNIFGSQGKPSENHANSGSTVQDTPPVDAIPYPTNFRQPKKESKDVDKIPYPENFRQPKSKIQENSETKTPTVNLVRVSKPLDDIPRTNIDDIVLAPIIETDPLDTTNLVNGSMEEKAPPKKIKRKQGVEWVGYNTPAGKPSALKSPNLKSRNEDKKMRISFNDSNMSETFEYQSEDSLLNEYIREERGMNGNPRVGNLSRQEAKDEDDQDDIDIDSAPAPSSQSSIDNVLAHEGLQNYTPKDLQNFSPTSFRQQQQQREAPKPREETAPPTNEDPDPDDIAITYDDTGDYFSTAGSSSAALLF